MVLGAFRYAATVPHLRAIKASLLSREELRELAMAPGLEESQALLRETPYRDIGPDKPPSAIQEIAMAVFFRRIRGIAKRVPARVQPIVLAFTREEEARDVLAIMKSLAAGRDLPLLPTAGIPGTLAYTLRRDPEALVSMQRLMEALERTWFKRHARRAARAAQELRDPEAYTLYSFAAGLRLYQEGVEALPKADWPATLRIICPLIHYRLAAGLANAKAMGVPVRVLDRIMEGFNLCGIGWARARSIYEREPGPQEILAGLREALLDIHIDTKLPYQEALERARITAYKEARFRAEARFAGYPFTAALAVAAAVLARIEALDIATIVTGTAIRLKPDEITRLVVGI